MRLQKLVIIKYYWRFRELKVDSMNVMVRLCKMTF